MEFTLNQYHCQLHTLKECISLAEQLNVDALLGQLLRVLEQELPTTNACFYIVVLDDEAITQLESEHIRIITRGEPGIYRAQALKDSEILGKLDRCLQTRSEQVIFLDDNMHSVLFPVESSNEFVGFLSLDIQEPGFTDKQREMIRAYLDLFDVHFNMLKKYRSDALTGLMNRGAFDEMMFQLVLNARRNIHQDDIKRPTLALLDIDFFKRINDNFGHVYGDEVLLLFAQIMRKSFRHFDWLFRYGGEEFAVILHNIQHEDVPYVLERFRRKVEEYNFPQVGKVTVSIGAVEIKPGDAVPVILDKADKALYFSKNNGRNQTHLYDALVQEGLLEEETIKTGAIDLF